MHMLALICTFHYNFVHSRSRFSTGLKNKLGELDDNPESSELATAAGTDGTQGGCKN